MPTPLEVFTSHGVVAVESGHHHCRRGWIQMDCPRCSPSARAYRLGFNIHRPRFNCWACGRLSIPEVLFALRIDMAPKVFLASLGKDRIRYDNEVVRVGKYVEPKGVGAIRRWHREYLETRRGLDVDQVIEEWELRGTHTILSDIPGRVFIPIRFQKQLVSWTSRAIDENVELRYLSAAPEQERVAHQSILYGIDKCEHVVIVHEGPGDVWRTGPGAVATFGTSILQSQVGLLTRFPLRVICLDNDRPGRKAASALADALAPFPGETIIAKLESGKDAGSASNREIRQLRQYLK